MDTIKDMFGEPNSLASMVTSACYSAGILPSDRFCVKLLTAPLCAMISIIAKMNKCHRNRQPLTYLYLWIFPDMVFGLIFLLWVALSVILQNITDGQWWHFSFLLFNSPLKTHSRIIHCHVSTQRHRAKRIQCKTDLGLTNHIKLIDRSYDVAKPCIDIFTFNQAANETCSTILRHVSHMPQLRTKINVVLLSIRMNHCLAPRVVINYSMFVEGMHLGLSKHWLTDLP